MRQLVPEPKKPGSRVRFPVTLYIDRIEFEPEISTDITRTAYDLELDEHDMRTLFDGLKERLEKKYPTATRIRFIGRLVS